MRHSARLARVRTIDASYAAELVQDILGDTILGVIVWDPERVELRKHVFDAIKSRIRHAIRHAFKFRPVRLDSCLPEAEAALTEAERWQQHLIKVNGEALAMLRELAEGDPEVILVLDAYDQRMTKRLPVMRFTKLTTKQYDAAWHRLRRLIDALPASLRAAAMEIE